MDAGNSNEGESRVPFLANNDATRNDWPVYPIFTSVPALNEAASLLAETTSYLAQCFPDFSEPVSRDSNGHEMSTFASGNTIETLSSNDVSSSGSLSALSGSSHIATDAPVIHDRTTRSLARDSSQNDNSIVQASSSSNSMFQGLIQHVQRTVRGSADDIG